MPTTVNHGAVLLGVPGVMRSPMASPFGQNVRAAVWLMTIARSVLFVSLHAKSRPARIGINMARKYSGDIVRKSTRRTCPGNGGGCPSTDTMLMPPVAASGTELMPPAD